MLITASMTQPQQSAPEWSLHPCLLPYPEAIATMQGRADAIRAGTELEQVWLVEHPPLYTAGTSAQQSDLINAAQFPTYDAGRGGQWTYHGPGQRTAYVMLDLTQAHGTVRSRDVRSYIHGLEEWLIRTLARLGVQGGRRTGRVGIWVEHGGVEEKIAAIGVRVTRWVSWHGVALNVHPDLGHFAGIVPCGIADHGVTSLHALGFSTTLAEADQALRAAWDEVFTGTDR